MVIPSDWLYDASDVVIDSGYVVMTPPLPGTGYAGENCAITSPNDQTGLKRLSQQITHNGQLKAFFSDRIEGGSSRVFERRDIGADTIVLCSDTPPGRYELTGAILDGRGGKVPFDLTVEIKEERVAGGNMEWFADAPTDYFLHETFDTDAADTQTLLDTYSLWSQIGVAPLEVDQNRLVGSQAGSWVLSGLRLDQLIPLSAHISVDIGRANSGGDHSVGVRLGDLNFSFAPGLDVSGIKGHFRVETWEGDEKIIRGVNQDMGFLPNVNVMHKFEATVSQADASASIVIIDGENSANRYEYFVTHPSLGRPYQLALTNHGHIGTGHVYHDNVIVSLINELIDSDGDGVPDNTDAFPNDPVASVDTDSDGVGDNADLFPLDATEILDADADGVGDNADQFDDDPFEAFDTDGDGIGNNADLDDDNDGFTDEEELADGTDPLSRFSCKSGCFSFDVDESLQAQPLTDGLLVIRHLFGFSGDSLTSGAVSGEASRGSSEAIAGYLTDADSQLDIDGDGESKPLTDGLLLIRYLFGFSGDSLISGAIGDRC